MTLRYCVTLNVVRILIWQGLQSASWEDALAAAKEALLQHKGSELRFIAGKLADAESLISLKACAPCRIANISRCPRGSACPSGRCL